jgi:hypothetical protein
MSAEWPVESARESQEGYDFVDWQRWLKRSIKAQRSDCGIKFLKIFPATRALKQWRCTASGFRLAGDR